jgi:tetratricopeptide (TPR) repeat protein
MTQNANTVRPAKPISAAVVEAASLLEKDSVSAEQRALAILKRAPGQPEALALLVSARRLANDLRGACDLLKEMTNAAPNLASLQYELGLVLQELGENDGAIAALRRVVELEPLHAGGWRALGDVLSKKNRSAEAARAYAKSSELSTAGLERLEIASTAERSQLDSPETSLRQWLKVHPTDVVALKLLGNVYLRLSRHEQAEEQLSKALALAPQFIEARWLLVGTFVYRGNWKMALSMTEMLLYEDPDNCDYLDTKAYSLLQLCEFDAGAAAYESLLRRYPTAENCTSYGRALKALGRTDDAISAYRQSLALNPQYGMAWWSLAELKTFRFEAADIETMKTVLNRSDLSVRSRALIHFALGRACEDAKQYENSFEQYRQANATVRSFVRHNPEQRNSFVQHSKQVFTTEYFRVRSNWGSARRDPIFIVGLPRSGTTLLEQILASHSLVEPTNELQCLEAVVRDLQHRTGKSYPELTQDLSIQQVAGAGDEYIARAGTYRKLNRPFFTDKMPNNFSYLGMILTALPNAKIIDARRHPLGGGFAIFKHYFVDAYSFAFDLASIGRYYRNYVELMAHFDAVQPGRVHRVFYEYLVAAPEQEIRRLLDYCALPFEQECLRFHDSKRAVHTPSSEQVRRPIAADAAELWRHYERWLDPLKSALGDVLEAYPDVPDFRESHPPMGWSLQQRIS